MVVRRGPLVRPRIGAWHSGQTKCVSGGRKWRSLTTPTRANAISASPPSFSTTRPRTTTTRARGASLSVASAMLACEGWRAGGVKSMRR